MKVYITGDRHGDFQDIHFFCKHQEVSREDVMVILGDAGLNYQVGNNRMKKMCATLPITLFCIHGNHEERPFNIPTYQEREWQGGIVYYEPEFPNLLFAKDGEIYDFNGKKAIAIGGAYSVDKFWRIRQGHMWFPDEQPSQEIREYVEQTLERAGWRVDYVLSHTCPESRMPVDLFLKGLDQSTVDRSTEIWLEEISRKLAFGRWYFGHFHDNRVTDCFEMLYQGIKELGDEAFSQLLGNPKWYYQEMVEFETQEDGEKKVLQGRIEVVNGYGTVEQRREVSYDIVVKDPSAVNGEILYKGVLESCILKEAEE